MKSTTTLTSKGQITIPKAIRKALSLQRGTRLTLSLLGQGFLSKPEQRISPMRRPAILEDRGILKHLDDGRSISKIIEEAKYLGALEIVRKNRR